MPVCTILPRHVMSRGSPTLTESRRAIERSLTTIRLILARSADGIRDAKVSADTFVQSTTAWPDVQIAAGKKLGLK